MLKEQKKITIHSFKLIATQKQAIIK